MSEKKYTGVIFDLDGVLCHTDKYHYQAWKMVADEMGIPFDEEINNRLRGVSRMESFEIILEKATRSYTQKEKEEYASKKNDIYVQLLRAMRPNDISPDVIETLEFFKEKDVKMAIGSSSKNAMSILEQTNLLEYFDAVADGTKIKRSKPDPDVFLLAAELLQLPVQECLVIEDAKSGIGAATVGGFDSAGIGDAYLDKEAKYHLKKLSDLISIFQVSNRV